MHLHPNEGRSKEDSRRPKGRSPVPRSARTIALAVRKRLLNPTLIAGTAALAWLLWRSGSKPSRLAYPCQQSALATASLVFGAPVVAALIVLRRRVVGGLRTPWGIAASVLLLLVAAAFAMQGFRTDAYAAPDVDPPADYRAEVFDIQDCPRDPVGERFLCVDDLVEMMGAHGLKFYRSDVTSMTAGPEGIVGADDVVVIKFNYQWPERGGTNVDVLSGLIRRVVDHPDSFTGEVVICENTQGQSSAGFDRVENNAHDHWLSPHDVVVAFQAQGYRVSHYDWRTIRSTQVGEYSTGNTVDGYVVYPYDPPLQGAVSYPKFETAYGTRVSLEKGIWTQAGGYDRDRLKFINVPVLKSHHAVYGATALVKNYMGVATNYLSTNSHTAVRHGILGSLLGRLQPADLNILDAIWINANPNDGPWTTYGGASRTDRLVATLDPVAGDIWAVKNILIPAFQANGYSPPWPYPSADPDDPGSAYREYLDNSMSYMLAAGHEVTNELSQIDGIEDEPPGEAADPDARAAPLRIAKHPAGYELTWSAPARGGPVYEYNLYRVDLAGMSAATAPECEAALDWGGTTVLAELPENHGLLVVARNPVGDGSFGARGAHAERPTPLPDDVCP